MKPQVLTSNLRAKLRFVRVVNSDANLRNFPDFLIVGPQRTGTTWLFQQSQKPSGNLPTQRKGALLLQHIGNARPSAFSFSLPRGLPWRHGRYTQGTFKRNYDSLRKVGRFYSPRIRGEATASYAALPEEVIREIATLNPEIKAILMIRDPLERAWSHARKDLLTEGQRADDLQTDALSLTAV